MHAGGDVYSLILMYFDFIHKTKNYSVTPYLWMNNNHPQIDLKNICDMCREMSLAEISIIKHTHTIATFVSCGFNIQCTNILHFHIFG